MNDAQIEAVFKEFDTSNDGFIDPHELQKALEKAGKKMDQAETMTLLKQVSTWGRPATAAHTTDGVSVLAPVVRPENVGIRLSFHVHRAG